MGGGRCKVYEGQEARSGVERLRCEVRCHAGADGNQYFGGLAGNGEEDNKCWSEEGGVNVVFIIEGI